MSFAILIFLFSLTACVYAIAGFGGGSTYLALMVFFAVPYEVMPQIALLCNMIVVSGTLLHSINSKDAEFGTLLPFLVGSIPCAYFGGQLQISKTLFFILLGFSLTVAGCRIWWQEDECFHRAAYLSRFRGVLSVFIGAAIGLLSGVVGIGGGIFLAPILYLLRWEKPRVIAFQASLFIFLNSLSGLWGQLHKHALHVSWQWLVPLLLAVLIGGQIGSLMSVRWLQELRLRQVTALLILFVAARIFWSLI